MNTTSNPAKTPRIPSKTNKYWLYVLVQAFIVIFFIVSAEGSINVGHGGNVCSYCPPQGNTLGPQFLFFILLFPMIRLASLIKREASKFGQQDKNYQTKQYLGVILVLLAVLAFVQVAFVS